MSTAREDAEQHLAVLLDPADLAEIAKVEEEFAQLKAEYIFKKAEMKRAQDADPEPLSDKARLAKMLFMRDAFRRDLEMVDRKRARDADTDPDPEPLTANQNKRDRDAAPSPKKRRRSPSPQPFSITFSIRIDPKELAKEIMEKPQKSLKLLVDSTMELEEEPTK